MNMKWDLAVCGCGTVGYWMVSELAKCDTCTLPERLFLFDSARIRKDNSITCPEYVGHAGQLKCRRLAELVNTWLSGRIDVVPFYTRVEQIQWNSVIRIGQVAHTIVLVGLDSWPSRMAVAEDLRHLVAKTSMDILAIQVGLDRGQASIAVYGCQFNDPCPACGLLCLPGGEPCVAWTVDNKLLRGNLHSEAKAAAGIVHSILTDLCRPDGKQSWLNTKINLVMSSLSGKGYLQFARPCSMATDCLGPHTAKTPIRWDMALGTITCGKESLWQ